MTNERKQESRGPGAGGRGSGGFGGRGPGGFGRGPGGPGGRDRGGFGGRGRREPRGPVGFEAAALEAARGVDKPILAGDFEGQIEPLEKLALAARKGGKSHTLEGLPEDARGKLFTALLRVMRQRSVEDEEKEAQRKRVFATLAEVWRALGDERRSNLAKEEAGDATAAPYLLAYTGEWDKVAALDEKEGRYREAAQRYEEHGRQADAARLYQRAGEVGKAFGILAQLGDREAIIAAAKELDPPKREEALLAAGMGDVLMDLLVQEERWEDVARLYERAEQQADAARAWERAGKTHKAIRAFDRAGERAEADRLIEEEAREATEAGDSEAAAKIWARFDRPERAAALTSDPLLKSRWLRAAGKVEEAMEVARAELEAGRAAEKPALELAPWMARSGDTAGALRVWDEHRRPEEAAKVLQELEEWELAARCMEVAGNAAAAAELFAKAGNEQEAERLRALIPPAPKTPRQPRRKQERRRPPQRR